MSEHRRFAGIGTALALSLAACSAPPPPEPRPLSPPEVQLEESWRVGVDFHGLTGGEASAASEGPATLDPVAVKVELLFADDGELSDLAELSPSVQAISSLFSRRPFTVVAPWLRRARVASGEAARRRFEALRDAEDTRRSLMGDFDEVLVPSRLWGVSVVREEVVRDPDDFLREFAARGPLRRSLELLVAREDEGRLFLLLASDDLAGETSRQRASRVGSEVPTARDDRQREVALLSPELGFEKGPVLIALPSIFLDGPEGSFVFLVEKVDAEGIVAAPESAWDELDEVDVLHHDQIARSVRSLGAILDNTRRPQRRRKALGRLAESLDAIMAEDFVWHGSEEDLVRISEALPRELDAESVQRLAWTLERAAFALAIEEISTAQPRPGIEACLLRAAGELGHDPAGLADVLRRSAGLDQFRAGLRAENRRLLEATNPTSRVRAYDWLRLQGVELGGFDPLAERDERRAALAALREQGS